MARLFPRAREKKPRAEIRHQHATRRLAPHEDDLLEASDAWGVAGVVISLVALSCGWPPAAAPRCSPTCSEAAR